MKIALWNVNGAASKEEEINDMMRGTNANCGIITETWLRPWHLRVFPAHFRYLSDIGLRTYLDDLRCLSQKNVSNKPGERYESRLQYFQASQNSTASVHSSHKFYEDWPPTLLDEGPC